MTRKLRTAFIIVFTLTAVLLVGVVGGLAFAYSGLYDIAADEPHFKVVRKLVTLVKRRSVEVRADEIEVPPLHDPALVQRGFVLYQEMCAVCHGAPGVARERIGVGLNPNPPPLVEAAERWSTAELYWIIENGLKLAGMPAFGLGEEPADLWALVAFTRRLSTLSPVEYRLMAAAARGRVDPERVPWLPGDLGYERMREVGNPERGRRLVEENGCNSCHLIPGVEDFGGVAGPPLERWAERHYIAGMLANTPQAMVPWLLDPHAIDPRTAMPDVGLTLEEAWHVTAYLFTLD